ncbi:hypothetical protein JJB11_12300 [Ramlibacter ginsenosidimutans]|uniref:Uncharacterized protein n=1 Tax=Ramlibacter ginsenosidimutans TaxID=502333 RepID=A0A934WMV1_9BURK|nr:hypothetical protein [Ramlibacter ginsenosidimutans]MBK6006873.1 hypothetical protein [Ramlibacter ginsenosidimutans]
MDWFGFLDALFSGGGGGGGFTSSGGGPTLNQGFAPVAGWMVAQAFGNAGPVGQYMGMLYGSPGTGIPSVDWGSDEGDFTQAQVFIADDYSASPQGANTEPTQLQPFGARALDALDRGDPGSGKAEGPVDIVNVFGSPPDRPSSRDWFETYLSTSPKGTFAGPEIQIPWPDPPPVQRPRPRRPSASKSLLIDPLPAAPEQPRPERDVADSGPYFDVDVTPSTVPYSHRGIPWMSDSYAPEQLLPWGSWQQPETAPAPRLEQGATGSLENTPTVQEERSFWSRGGTGLAAGAVTGAVGLAIVFWWNPVGWVAGASAALAIAGGLAATTASTVELAASYGGATSSRQDEEMNRAVSATLGYSSVGGVLGGVAGTVLAENAQEGYEAGAMWGGLAEAATSLPAALRAVPELWNAALPWGKSLLLTPFWFFMSSGGGGGSTRSLARAFAAQGRIASRIRTVEYLGVTPLVEREADWARFQVFATRTRNESVFRITYANGEQRIVLADRFTQGSRTILEAKYGDMGQMWNPTREAHIIGQANAYLEITALTDGRVGYLVSTERGASRLAQRFGREFPAQMASGQLWVDWVPWP